MPFIHEPVLLTEVINWLALKSGDNVIDGTVGGGGHSLEILKATAPTGVLWGFDQDVNAINAASEKLIDFKNRIYLINQPFQNIKHIAYDFRTPSPHGVSAILVDCGVSSFQFSAEDNRGFSFNNNSRLDMRFGEFSDLTAERVVNDYDQSSLTKIFQVYGEERRAKKFAERIISHRRRQPIATVNDLLQALGLQNFKGRIHPATKVFQAIRMEVNDELGAIERGLPDLASYLVSQGRLAVITFHSVEDRCVKQTLLKLCASNDYRLLTKHVIKPSRQEILANKRSRSAKLRVIEKI